MLLTHSASLFTQFDFYGTFMLCFDIWNVKKKKNIIVHLKRNIKYIDYYV